MDQDKILNELRGILNDSGISNSKIDDVLNITASSGILNDPYGNQAKSYQINAQDFTARFLNEGIQQTVSPETLSDTNIVFYPRTKTGTNGEEQLIGFSTWMASPAHGAVGEENQIITNKLRDFSVNLAPDYEGIVHRGIGGAFVDGVSFDPNTGTNVSQLGSSRVNREMVSAVLDNIESNVSYSQYLSQNPERIRLDDTGGISGMTDIVKYSSMSLPKNYESNRPVSLMSTLKFMDQDSGILLNSFLGNDKTGFDFFSDFQTKDNSFITNKVFEDLGKSTRKVDRDTIIKSFQKIYTEEASVGLNYLSSTKKTIGSSNALMEAQIITRINSDRNKFTKNYDSVNLIADVQGYFSGTDSSGVYDQKSFNSFLTKRLGIDDMANSYSNIISSNMNQFSGSISGTDLTAALSSVSGKANFSYSTMDIVNQSRATAISGATMNEAMGTSMFGSGKYSIKGVIDSVNIGNTDFLAPGQSLDFGVINKLESRFDVVEGKTMVTMPRFFNGNLVNQTIKTGFSGMDMNRIAESGFKTRGLMIADNLMNSAGTNSSEVIETMTRMNHAISTRDYAMFQNSISGLDDSSKSMFGESFRSGQVLNLSELLGKDKFKGETSLFGYSTVGGLGILDKAGARKKQVSEVLQDATIGSGSNMVNIAMERSNALAVKGSKGGLVNSSFFRGKNADAWNLFESNQRSRIESKYIDSNVQTRGGVSGLVGNIIGMYDENVNEQSRVFVQDLVYGFNESAIVSKDMARSLVSERYKEFDINSKQIIEQLRSSGVANVNDEFDNLRNLSGKKLLNKLGDLGLIDSSSYDSKNAMSAMNFKNYIRGNDRNKLYNSSERESVYKLLKDFELNSKKTYGNYDAKKYPIFNKTSDAGASISDSFYNFMKTDEFRGVNSGGLLKDLNFQDAFSIGDAVFDDKGSLILKYHDFNETKVGSKNHSLTTSFKYTISSISDWIKATDVDSGASNFLAMSSSTKELKRGWSGGSMMSTLGAGLYLSATGADDLSGDFLNNLKNFKLGDDNIDLLKLLGLNIDSTSAGFSHFDGNAMNIPGSNKEMAAKIRGIIDNPILNDMAATRRLKKRFSEAGIRDKDLVYHYINQAYDKTMQGVDGGYQKLVGDKIMEASGGIKFKALVALGLEQVATTGADQTFPTGDALRIGRMESRFFDQIGFSGVGSMMRKSMSNDTVNYFSQIQSPGHFSINALASPANAMSNKIAYSAYLKDTHKDTTVFLNTALIKSGDMSRDDMLALQRLDGGMSFDRLAAGDKADVRNNIIKQLSTGSEFSDDVLKSGLLEQLPTATQTKLKMYQKASPDQKKGKTMKKIKKELIKEISGTTFASGVAAFFDEGSVLGRAATSVSDGTKRSLPTIVLEGEELDVFNKFISEKMTANKVSEYFGTNKVFEQTFADYRRRIEAGDSSGLNNSGARTLRANLLTQLESHKSSNSPLNHLIKEIASTKDLDEASNLMLFLTDGARGAAINRSGVYGALFEDQKGNEFLNPLIRSFESLQGLVDFENYSSAFTGIQDDVSNFTGSGKLDITGRIKSTGFFEKTFNNFRDFNEYDKEILDIIKRSTSGPDGKTMEYLIDNLSAGKSAGNSGSGMKELNKLIQKVGADGVYLNQTDQVSIGGKQGSLSKSLNRVTNKLFSKIYGVDHKVINDLTKKGTLFSSGQKFTIDNSFAGQFAEGSAMLDVIGKKIVGEMKTAGSSITNASQLTSFQDLSEVFGQGVVEEIFFGGVDDLSTLKSDGKFDITKLNKFKKKINEIESITMLNSVGIDKRDSDMATDLAKLGRKQFGKGAQNNRGFMSLFARFPLQGGENLISTLSFMVDVNAQGRYNDDNFLIDFLKSSDFESANSGIVVGKKTAIRFRGDFDGDKFYHAALDKHFNPDQLQTYVNESAIRFLGSTGNLRNDKMLNLFGIGEEAKEKLSKQIDFSESYYAHTNRILDIKLTDELAGHQNVKQVLNLGKKTQDVYASYLEGLESTGVDKDGKLLKLSNPTQKLEDELVDTYTSLRGVDKKSDGYFEFEETTRSSFRKQRGAMKKMGGISEKAADAFSAANIDKAGDVYYQINSIRNLEQILSQGNMTEGTYANLFSGGLRRNGINNIDSGVAQEKVMSFVNEKLGWGVTDNAGVVRKMKDLQEGILSSSFMTSNLQSEGIELGVISAKNASEAIYSKLGQIATDIFASETGKIDDKFEIFAKHYADNSINMAKILGNDDSLENMLMMINRLGEGEDTLSKNFNSILNTYMGERSAGRGAEARITFAGEIASSIRNLSNASVMGKVMGAIDQETGGGRKPGHNPMTYLGDLLGLDIKVNTRKGKNEGLFSFMTNAAKSIVSYGGANDGDSFINEDEVRMIREEADAKFVKSYAKQHEVDADEVINKLKVNIPLDKKNDAPKIDSKTKGKVIDRVKNLSGTKLKIAGAAAGILALGSFLSYNKRRSNVTTYDEQDYEGELGLGAARGSFDFTTPNNLGYYD